MVFYKVKVQMFGNDGTYCFRQKRVTVTKKASNKPCNDFRISMDNGKLIIADLTAPIEIVNLFNKNWQEIYTCRADCGDEQIIEGLARGKYHLIIKAYSADWKYICRKKITFKIRENGIEIVNESRSTFQVENPLISPNPATNQINIQLADYANEKAEVRILSYLGKEMKYLNLEKIPDAPISIDLNNWTNGIYFVQIKLENRPLITQKLIVNRMY